MADNYLEKKFEEYSIRKSTAKTKKIVSTGPKPEHIEVRFPTRRVFVTGGSHFAIMTGKTDLLRLKPREPGSIRSTYATAKPCSLVCTIYSPHGATSISSSIMSASAVSLRFQKHRSTTSTVSSPPTYDRYSSRPEKWPCTDNLYPDPIITDVSSILPLPATL